MTKKSKFLSLPDLIDIFLLGWSKDEINEFLYLKMISDKGIPKKITRNKISSFNGAPVK